MARIDYYSCDPFRAWNRLEGRPRQSEFDQALAASIHDPLWFLTRQWQFGELQAEDTGSAIFAKTLMQVAKITKTKKANDIVRDYAEAIPMETLVEEMPFKPNNGNRADAAMMLVKSLDLRAAELGAATYSSAAFKQRLKTLYPFDLPALPTIANTNAEIIAAANTLANDEAMEFRQTLGARYFDGFKAHTAIKTNKTKAVKDISGNDPAFTTLVSEAVDLYVQWFARQPYAAAIAANQTAWVAERLEYSFDCAFPSTGSGRDVLSAAEYASGDMDWYCFDVNKHTDKPIKGNATAAEIAQKSTSLLTVIPTEASFAGAPNARWWQFEDGRIDLGNIHTQSTDIAKLVFSEYALLYSNDWMMIPCRMPVGSVCSIAGIVVTDVFGEQSFVPSANQGQHDNWNGWGMYNMSVLRDVADKTADTDTRLFIAPALPKAMTSEPVESVHLLRDEMTNMVWAIETRLPDDIGGTIDASKLARTYTEILAGLESVQGPMVVPDENAMFRYVLGNTVPENWIPFLPVHIPGNQRSIQLQRAAMPRLFNNEFSRVRPRTAVMRYGIRDDDGQDKPYFLHEEEVPRAGVQVKGSFQRGRWYNGKVVGWYGYLKQTGRGEGSSGLYYDRLLPVTGDGS